MSGPDHARNRAVACGNAEAAGQVVQQMSQEMPEGSSAGLSDAAPVSPGGTTSGAACPTPRRARPPRPPWVPAPTRRRRTAGTAAPGGGWPHGPVLEPGRPARVAGLRCGRRVPSVAPRGAGPRPRRASGRCVRQQAPGRARGAAGPARSAGPLPSRRDRCPAVPRPPPGRRRPSSRLGARGR